MSPAIASCRVEDADHRVRGAAMPAGRQAVAAGASRSAMAARRWPAAKRAMWHCALALLLVAGATKVSAASSCLGDCSELGRVTAADLVRLTQIAAGDGDVAECSAGFAGEDGHISQDEIDQAVRNIFADCAEAPAYDALAGEVYHISYPTDLVSLPQAAAIVAALETLGAADEAAIRAHLTELLPDLGLEATLFEEIGIVAQREASDCEDCLATCSGRCVQSPRGDCFCYERLPTDPARGIAVLFLERAEDAAMALDAQRIPCTDTLLHLGVNDSFATANGVEPMAQSPGLLALFQAAGQTPANFDQTAIDKLFGQTFTLPQGKCLVAAKVLLRVRPIASSIAPGPRNDVLRLGFVNPAGQFAGPLWAAYFGTGTANTGLPLLLGQQWTASNYPSPGASFALNLASLPGGTNLLPALACAALPRRLHAGRLERRLRRSRLPPLQLSAAHADALADADADPYRNPWPVQRHDLQADESRRRHGLQLQLGLQRPAGHHPQRRPVRAETHRLRPDLRRVRGSPVHLDAVEHRLRLQSRLRHLRASSAPPSAPPAASSPATTR